MEEKAVHKFIIIYGKYIIILFLVLVIGIVLLYLTYNNFKQEQIEGLNARQMIHAKQAARAIETFFGDHITILQNYAKNDHIVNLDEPGKRLMREFLSSHGGEVSIITRVDSEGRILYPEPYDRNVIGQSMTKMEDFLKVKLTRQIAVSDVFKNRRGFQSIIVHAPVFKQGSFDGTLAILISFDFIAKRYIEDIRIGKDGYAWMISRNGIEISCPVPGHVGNSVFDNCRAFPDILAMAKRMIKGEQGVTTYIFDRIREGVVSKTIKHALYMPIKVGNNFWSIVVATPEDELLSSMQSFRDRIIVIAIIFIVVMWLFFYLLFRTNILVKEVDRRRKVEEALRESEEHLKEAQRVGHVGSWDLNVKTGDLHWSDECYRIYGFRPQEFVPTYDKFRSIVHPDDLKFVQEQVDAALNNDKHYDVDFRFARPNGEIGWIHCEGEVMRDAQGKPIRFFGTQIDITERKLAEVSIRDSEEKFSKAFEKAPLLITISSISDGSYLDVNEKFVEVSGFKREEAIGKTSIELGWLNPKDRDLLIHDLKEKGSIEGIELELIAKDKRKVSCLYYGGVINIGGQQRLLSIAQDITERKRAEEALLESETKYQAAFELSSDAIFWADIDTEIIINCNRAAENMIGLHRDKFIGQNRAMLHPPELKELYAGHFRRHTESGSAEESEAVVISTSGQRIPVLISASRLKLGNRDILQGIFRDITGLKQAEEKLQKSEEKFNKAFHSSPIPTAISTIEDGRFLDVNEIFLQTLLFSREEVIGKTSLELGLLANPAQRQAIRKITEEKGYANNIETQIIAKNGQIIDGLFSAEPITINNEECWLTIMVDVTEQKRSENALRESETKYRNLFDQATDGIMMMPIDGSYITVNESFARLHGYDSPKEMEYVKLSDLDTPETAKLAPERMRRLLAGEAMKFEVEHYHKDGHILSLDVACNIINIEDKSYYLGFHKDITERKQAEKRHRDLEERLQRSEKMEALGTLAGGVAHDLNNVLGIVVGYSEMLMDEIDVTSPLREDMMKIMEAGNRSAAIVQDLLTLARRGVHTRKVVNLNDTVADTQRTPEFEKLFSSNSFVHLDTDLEMDLLNIMGSPVHLSKTIFNLTSNAVEAMPNGGTIMIKTSNLYLDWPIRGYDNVREGDYVVLAVSDTGEGIPERDIKRIFEPFYTKKVMGRSGTGLGLAVVWGTVKDHNGYINVESEEGKGTTFTLYFPVTRSDIDTDQTSLSLSEYMGKGESILVVDDVKGQRDLASRMLSKLNYIVSTVASGEEAVEYLKTSKTDLIVLDMIMDPGIDGLDTYKQILEINPAQKAVIVSGFSESDRVKEAQKLGAGTYVKKPYVLERLGIVVRKELDRK